MENVFNTYFISDRDQLNRNQYETNPVSCRATIELLSKQKAFQRTCVDGDGSTAQIAIARKSGFQPNPKIRCLVLGKTFFLVRRRNLKTFQLR